jgi:hypothetical protein
LAADLFSTRISRYRTIAKGEKQGSSGKNWGIRYRGKMGVLATF